MTLPSFSRITSYNVCYTKLLRLQRKLKNIKDTGAPVVAMDCPGCVMQIRGGMDQDGAGVQVRHTVELIANQLAD